MDQPQPFGSRPNGLKTQRSDVEESGAYLLEMLASLAQFAYRSDLPNTSVMLSTVSEVVRQEIRMKAVADDAHTSDDRANGGPSPP